MNKLVYIFGTIIVVYCLAIIFSGSLNMGNLFKNLNIIQLFTPIIQVSSILGAAYFVNIILNKKNKSIDILVEILDEYKDFMDDLHDITLKYIRTKDIEDAKIIKWNLKRASNKINNIEKIQNAYTDLVFTYTIEEMKQNRIKLKQSITDESFMQTSSYSNSKKIEIINNFDKIEMMIHKEKINLFQ